MDLSYHDLDLTDCAGAAAIAVGVSGGPDSLALAFLLRAWAIDHAVDLHVLSVDHGLRSESNAEARQVGEIVSGWPHTIHQTLTWSGKKPASGLPEAARAARYDLMEHYCKTHHIRFLFLAHHQDDQAETFLLRLAKGSGLDGLAAMQARQARGDIMLARPLLSIPKQTLVDFCVHHDIPFVRDPTNEDQTYSRPRLRAARAILEEEGLSAKRLATTASRLARARSALEWVSETYYAQTVSDQSTKDAQAFDLAALRALPDDIVVRIVQSAMRLVRVRGNYPPRLEKLEEIVRACLSPEAAQKTTLGGCLFVPDHQSGLLWIRKEKP